MEQEGRKEEKTGAGGKEEEGVWGRRREGGELWRRVLTFNFVPLCDRLSLTDVGYGKDVLLPLLVTTQLSQTNFRNTSNSLLTDFSTPPRCWFFQFPRAIVILRLDFDLDLSKAPPPPWPSQGMLTVRCRNRRDARILMLPPRCPLPSPSLGAHLALCIHCF